VRGNTTVGGLVGWASGATLKNNYVNVEASTDTGASGGGTTSTTSGIMVKGVLYKYTTKVGEEDKDYIYLPTSVGGLVGVAEGCTIQHNALDKVSVGTVRESENTGDDATMVSTTRNYMTTYNIGSGNSENTFNSDTAYNVDTSNYTYYDEVYTGIGGFAGSIDGDTLLNSVYTPKEAGAKSLANPNYLLGISVDAQVGINVGTYYGYYKSASVTVPVDDGEQTVNITLPYLYNITEDSKTEDISVQGGYNVGGMAGFVDGEIGNVTTSFMLGSPTVAIQKDYAGMFVGGLFGKTNANSISGLNISSTSAEKMPIKIYASNIYHAGGLIGRATVDKNTTISGSIGVWSSDSVIVDTDSILVNSSGEPYSSKSTDASDLQAMSTNFGGLIGMLKVAKTTTPLTVNVDGSHNYPFTINTIQNGNYADGATQFDTDVQENAGEVSLHAQAYYINQDSFNITGSKNAELYNQDGKDSNPLLGSLNGYYTGWSKEYTGFRVMQRCIPQAENNGATWDSIGTVFDAQYITGVGTYGNLGLTGDFKYGPTPEDVTTESDYIVYTIYDMGLENPIMYTVFGIGTVAKDQNGKLAHSSSGKDFITYKDYETNYKSLLEERKVDDYGSDKIYEDTNDAGYNVKKEWLLKTTSEDLGYFTWQENKTDEGTEWVNLKGYIYAFDIKGESSKRYDLAHNYFYELNYMGQDLAFDFQVIYVNESTKNIAGAYHTNESPMSGSLFEVCGMSPSFANATVSVKTDWIAWVVGISIATVIFVLVAIATIKTGGTALEIIKVLAAWAGILYGAAILAPIAISISGEMIEQYGVASRMYFSAKDQNLGFLSSMNMDVVSYEDHKYKGAIGSQITVADTDGETYIYYFASAEKPKDYYASYYMATPIGTDLTSGSIEYKSYYDTSITTRTNSKYTYDYQFTQEGTEYIGTAYQKYVYENGAYYYLSISMDVDGYESFDLIDVSDVSDTKLYQDGYGRTYVRGDFEKGEYTFNDDYSNNRVTIDDEGNYKLNGYTLSKAEIEKYDEDTTTEFWYMNPTQYDAIGTENTNKYVKGYDYIDEMYYTRNGYESLGTKYAQFDKVDSLAEGLRENIDYVMRTVYIADTNGKYYEKSSGEISPLDSQYNNESKYRQETWYYEIDLDTQVSNGSTDLSIGIFENVPAIDSINLAIYPYSFTNPYNAENTSALKAYGTITSKFINKNSQGVEPSFDVSYKQTHTIKYYYLDNGYKTDSDFVSNFESMISDTGVDLLNNVYLKLDGDYELVFNKLDSNHKITSTLRKTVQEFLDEGLELSTYADWVVGDLSDMSEKDLKEIDITILQVKNNYKEQDDWIYEKTSKYMIKNGKIHKVYPTVANQVEDAYLYKKYCTNTDWGFYSMFKFVDKNGNVMDLTSVTDWYRQDGDTKKDLYLYPQGADRTGGVPNAGYTTYFVESVKVTLSGGQTLSHTGIDGKTIQSGNITIG